MKIKTTESQPGSGLKVKTGVKAGITYSRGNGGAGNEHIP
jgi:hypothetical protein